MRKVHFFVHVFNNLNVQNILELETSELRPKQNRRPERRKYSTGPPLAILVFFT